MKKIIVIDFCISVDLPGDSPKYLAEGQNCRHASHPGEALYLRSYLATKSGWYFSRLVNARKRTPAKSAITIGKPLGR